MSNLESTRSGWFFRGLGVFFMLLAIGLTVMDLIFDSAIWPVNLVTLGCGFWCFHIGTRMIRSARKHRQFMEAHRAEIARLRRDLGMS